MALISQSDLEAKLGRTLTANEVTIFAIVNPANQAYVEKLIGSSVESDTASTRYYDGGVRHLKVDPCTDVTAVKYYDEDQTVIETIDASDYVLDPINHTLKTQVTARFGRFYRAFSNVGVTAKFSIYGDTDTLNVVISVLLDALESDINDSDNILKENIEGYSVEFSKTQTKSTLDKIRFLFAEII